jgi:tetraacyldisaccharide 4'-kinase
MENFQAIADDFRAAGACVTIQDAGELAAAVERVLQDPGQIGDRARECSAAKRGATARAVDLARDVYRIPRYRMAFPYYAPARALSAVWRSEARRRAVRDYRLRLRLPVPVISIGNITMGGSGKTPCVLRLAELLRDRGRTPGILTRGYGRHSPVKSVVLAPGASARVETTGDEPQIFLRSGLAPVGIGADRYETGSLLLQEFGTDVVLLDDGFQHVKLARNLDVLLIDGVNPFGGGQIFPAGRLREPLAGVARANVIVITRSNVTDLVSAIEQEVRRHNPTAPIVRAHVEPECWVQLRTGRCHALNEIALDRAAGFCGLGNPQGFRRTLAALRVKLVDWVEFEDHHRYTPAELRLIAAHSHTKGATAILTTEKDAVNLAESASDQLAPLPLYWLKVSMRFDNEKELIDPILKS